jgi:hypothetical protein
MAAAKREPSERRSFYLSALDEEDQKLLLEAMQVDGIDEEIAVLRYVVRKELEKTPAMYDALCENASRLVRAVAAQYRMSPKSAEDFAKHITAVLNDLATQMMADEMGGGDV